MLKLAGNVDLIAPNGSVDAGDAGIRVAGNLNIAANRVLNAGNIAVSGASAGTPAAVSVSANVGGLTSASAAATGATANATPDQPSRPNPADVQAADTTPSIITVEVIGYGGSPDSTDEDKAE